MQGPSRYGGIAALLVLGIGLLAVGKTWPGIVVLAFGLLCLAIVVCPSASGRALLGSIMALLVSGVLGWHAARNELTGTATYSRFRHSYELVTREKQPAKFREATNLLWGGSLFFVLIALIAFTFSRKLDDAEADFGGEALTEDNDANKA